ITCTRGTASREPQPRHAVIASLAVTPETRRRVDFSCPYYRATARFACSFLGCRRDVSPAQPHSLGPVWISAAMQILNVQTIHAEPCAESGEADCVGPSMLSTLRTPPS